MKYISRQWHKMSKDQKRNYQELSDRDRKRFDYERKCWNAMHEEEDDFYCAESDQQKPTQTKTEEVQNMREP